jgi:hypothetical protein
MILNHNIGVNLSDAITLDGHTIEEFSMVGHTHNASQITSGVMHPDRLPKGTTTGQGVVQLSSATNSVSELQAATSKAVNDTMEFAKGRAASVHTHSAADITAGKIPVPITTASTDQTGTPYKQLRNIVLSTVSPLNMSGEDGDIWFEYEE